MLPDGRVTLWSGCSLRQGALVGVVLCREVQAVPKKSAEKRERKDRPKDANKSVEKQTHSVGKQEERVVPRHSSVPTVKNGTTIIHRDEFVGNVSRFWVNSLGEIPNPVLCSFPQTQIAHTDNNGAANRFVRTLARRGSYVIQFRCYRQRRGVVVYRSPKKTL